MDEEGTIEDGTIDGGTVDEGTTSVEASFDVDAPDVEVAVETPPAGTRERSRWRLILRRGVWSLVALTLLIVLFFTQTGRGQRIVLNELLGRLRGSLAGELSVESIGSRTLLFGLTLEGVRLDAEGGRRFLEADSVVVRYGPLSLALGSPRISSTTFFGLDVEISRYPSDDFTNVNRILTAGSPDDTIATPPQTLGLGRVAIRGGNLDILVPAADDSEAETLPAPGGGRLRRMALQDLDLDVEEVVYRSEGPVTVDARLASLSASVLVLSEPLMIHEAQGSLSFGDRGLTIDGAAFRLPGSFLEGGLSFGPGRPGEPWSFSAEFRSDEWGDLADIDWVDPRIPSGRFRGGAEVLLVDGVQVTFRDVEIQAAGSSVVLDGSTHFGDVMSMRSLRVIAEPLLLTTMEPWLDRDLPFSGSVRGSATLAGTIEHLDATGRMTFTPDSLPFSVTTADFSGTIHSGANPGGSSLQVRLDPLDFRALEPVWADARLLRGGRATVSIEGRADDGLLLVADVTHRSDFETTSRAVGRGVVRRDADLEWVVDVRAELAPLSLPLLGRIWPQIDLPGSVGGPVRASGRLTDLQLAGDLTGDAGRLVFDATADLTTPAAGYRVEVDADALDISAFTSNVPAPSVVSGSFTVEGAGFALDSLEGSASVALRSARVGGLAIDSATAALSAAEGLLTASSMRADVAGILVDGSGSLGMTAERSGQARFDFTAESLLGLRPVFMGDSILVGDTLNGLEQDALQALGIDPDTLPTAMDVRMAGALRGTAEVRGWIGDLDLDLVFELRDGAYGHNSVDSADVSLMASGLPETRGDWDVDVSAAGIVWADREFGEVRFDGTMLQRSGEGTLDVVRRPGENYFLTGAFALDSLGGELELADAVIQVSDLSWVLSHPTTMAWDESSLVVDSLEVTRAGDDPMRLAAAGTLTRGGESDFRMVMEGFHIEQVLRIAQREDIDLSGHVDLDVDITGPAERPVINASVEVEDPRYGAFQLSRLEGSLEYLDRLADFRLSAWDADRRVLTGAGVVPVDLALAEVESRSVEEAMDVMVTADSLNAALALVYLGMLEDVVGTVSAEMHIGGTPSRPEPSGTVTLADAAWTVDALGVRHTGVSGELLLQPDRTVAIKLATTGASAAAGTSTVSGLVRLEPVTDPELDLVIGFDRFLAVDRLDVQSRITGDLTLTGRYQLPVTEGTVIMEEGTLFVEEFARNAGVVDLRSPLLYAPGISVDTTVFVTQPLIADLSNPFLDNLRVAVDMAVPRNLWLRSRDMNVEMGGDLIMRYDRGQSDLVLVGELEALRGSYGVLGRTFEVDGGTASFLGQPGINPTLDIQALSRVRRREGDPLEVRATVQGTLVEPLVTLSTEEAGLSQSDLISYLLVGGPSGDLGTRGAVTTGLGTYVAGAFVSQVGTAIAQEIPLVNRLDYLAFSQADAFGQDELQNNAVGSVFGGTQVELGKYLNDDVFVIFVLGGQNSAGADGGGTSFTFRGVRMELAVAENVFVEVFMEDRFLQSGSGGLGATGLDGSDVVGIIVFGEWGFGSQQQQ